MLAQRQPPLLSMVRYVPRPPLDRYVDCFWWSRRDAPQAFCEHMLPSGRAHLVFALHEEALSYARGGSTESVAWRGNIVHGPQWGHYVTGPKLPGVVAGVSLRAGSAGAILGAPTSEIADKHVSLSSLWGTRADELQERLSATREPSEAFALLERYLSARIEAPLLMHPAVAEVLATSWMPDRVSTIQRSTGFSPKHFIALFRAAVGLTPKHYFRIQRFNEVTRRLALQLEPSLSDLAAELGYSDQAHLSREFRELAGISPSHYRGRPESPLHHPG